MYGSILSVASGTHCQGGGVSEHILHIRGGYCAPTMGICSYQCDGTEHRVGKRCMQLVSLSKYKAAPAHHCLTGSFFSAPEIGRGYSLVYFAETISFCLHGCKFFFICLKKSNFFFWYFLNWVFPGNLHTTFPWCISSPDAMTCIILCFLLVLMCNLVVRWLTEACLIVAALCM